MLRSVFLIATATGLFCLTSALRAQPLSEKSFEEILKSYSFIGDLSTYPAEPQVSGEIFWRYPVSLPFIDFPPAFPDEQLNWQDNYPSTQGAGRAYEHLNGGRQAFLQGDYEKARKMWLGRACSLRAAFPRPQKKRLLLASTFLMLAKQAWFDPLQGPQAADARENLAHANTFFLAYGRKKEVVDELVESRTPGRFIIRQPSIIVTKNGEEPTEL